MNLERTALFWVITQRVVVFIPDVSEQTIGPIVKVQELEVVMTAMIFVVIIRVMAPYSLVGCQHLIYYMTVLWLNNNL
jgi:hypothetical protein